MTLVRSRDGSIFCPTSFSDPIFPMGRCMGRNLSSSRYTKYIKRCDHSRRHTNSAVVYSCNKKKVSYRLLTPERILIHIYITPTAGSIHSREQATANTFFQQPLFTSPIDDDDYPLAVRRATSTGSAPLEPSTLAASDRTSARCPPPRPCRSNDTCSPRAPSTFFVSNLKIRTRPQSHTSVTPRVWRTIPCWVYIPPPRRCVTRTISPRCVARARKYPSPR